MSNKHPWKPYGSCLVSQDEKCDPCIQSQCHNADGVWCQVATSTCACGKTKVGEKCDNDLECAGNNPPYNRGPIAQNGCEYSPRGRCKTLAYVCQYSICTKISTIFDVVEQSSN